MQKRFFVYLSLIIFTFNSFAETVVYVNPTVITSPPVGEQLTININIARGENVAGYEFKVNFDPTALQYVSAAYGDYLPPGSFSLPPTLTENSVLLAATAVGNAVDGDGTLAIVTFEVIEVKTSTLRLTGVVLADPNANSLPLTTNDGIVTAGDKPGFNPNFVPDQVFFVARSGELILPPAGGGTPPYTYTLAPELPPGLNFDPSNRRIEGTPSTFTPPHFFNYTVTDTNGATATLTFTLQVSYFVDVNEDGEINVIDLIAVALLYGTDIPAGLSLPVDVNADGVVNILDLTAVAQAIDAADNNDTLIDREAALLAAASAAMGFTAKIEASKIEASAD